MFFPKLPTAVRQMVYPEKPAVTKQTIRVGTGHSNHSREKKFRISRNHGDYWQDNIDQWVKDKNKDEDKRDKSVLNELTNNIKARTKLDHKAKKVTRTSSQYSVGSDTSSALNKEYVHHMGFQGQSTEQLKYKFPKAKTLGSSTPSTQTTQSTFRPKGYGSLYDELEFERRYKKVFDLNKHIHFVHSNFLNGQRIVKRTKLPPIGQVSSTQSDPSNGGDIFAIMSVQKYNHPEEFESTHAPATTPGRHMFSADGSPDRNKRRRKIEISQEMNVPIGFVPGTIKSTDSNPFEGIQGNVSNSNNVTDESYRLLKLNVAGDRHPETDRSNRTFLTGSEETERSVKSVSTAQTKTTDEHGFKGYRKSRKSRKEREHRRLLSETPDEMEPFNISVHVEIKPKDKQEWPDKLETVQSSLTDDLSASDEGTFEEEEQHGYDAEEEQNFAREKVMFPTKIFSYDTEETNDQNEDKEKMITPRNISTTSNQYGFVTKKVQYPERFVLDKAMADDTEKSVSAKENKPKILKGISSNKVHMHHQIS